MNADDFVFPGSRTQGRPCGRGVAALAILLLLSAPLSVFGAAKPAGPAAAGSLPQAKKSGREGLYLVTEGKDVALPRGELRVEVKDKIKYYRVPLRGVPETRTPVKIRDTFPADGVKLSLFNAKDDGLLFSWDTTENNFDEGISFVSSFESKDENVMIWPELTPGLYAFVEVTGMGMGIGKACFVFRVVP